MRKFEARLIDPSPGEIAETVSEAAAATNKRCRTRLLADDPAKWRKIARQCGGEAEGFAAVRGGRGGVPATQVIAGWWTDHIGRKHVVVRGRRVESKGCRVLLDPTALAARPPLWHCYPEYLARRHTRAGSEWVAVCGCGAMGTPAALGWMGDCCGPCHDRREELGPRALAENRPGLLYGVRGRVTAVAFSPDGGRVAAGDDGGVLTVWPFARGTDPTQLGLRSRGEIRSFCFTADGRYVVHAGDSEPGLDLPADGALAADLAADPPVPVRLPGSWERVYGVARAAEPGRVVLSVPAGLEVVDVPAGTTARRMAFAADAGAIPHPAPGGRVVVLLADRARVYDTATGATVADVRYSREFEQAYVPAVFRYAAYDPATGRLVLGYGGRLDVYDAAGAGRLAGADLNGQEFRRLGGGHPGNVSGAAFAPDSRHLYVATTTGRLFVLRPDTLAPVVAFDWHLDAIRGMAVSPDGETLATGGAEGLVKLWPVRRLLEGLGA